jgi:RNA polymerase subunit RPABC4/transcription elongation factor Spt4
MDNCPICLESVDENNSTILGCDHVFCIDCVKKMLTSEYSFICPLCRSEITEFTNNNEKSLIIIRGERIPVNRNQNTNVGLNDYKFLVYKYYFLWLLLVSTIFWLADERYYNILLDLQIKEITDINNNITNSLNECNNELSLIDDNLVPSYLYERDSGNIIFCQIPQYFLKKCVSAINSMVL